MPNRSLETKFIPDNNITGPIKASLDRAAANFADLFRAPPWFAALSAAGGADIASDTTVALVERYSATSSSCPTIYEAVASEPAHALKFQAKDGRWFAPPDWDLDARAFGVKADNATNNVTAFNRAVAWLNLSTANDGRRMRLPPGIMRIQSQLDPITVENVTIEGSGRGPSMIRMTGTTSNGRFFEIGTTTQAADIQRVRLANVRLWWSATTAAPTEAAIKLNRVKDSQINIEVQSVPAVLDIGPNLDCSRIELMIFGSWRAEYNLDCLKLNTCSSLDVILWRVTSVLAGTGKQVNFNSTGYIDTVTFHEFAMQSGAQGSGHAKGIHFNSSNGNIFNIWFVSGFLDWTTEYTVLFEDNTASTYNIRNVDMSGIRLTADEGACVKVNRLSNSGTATVWDAIRFRGCVLNYEGTLDGTGNNPAVEVRKSGSSGGDTDISFDACKFKETDAAADRNGAIDIYAGGVKVRNCDFLKTHTGTSKTKYAVRTLADIDRFMVVGNTALAVTQGFISEFAYVTGGTKKLVANNLP